MDTKAILKLSGNDVEQVRRNTQFAKEDFRDVRVWAEYPRQGKRGSMPDGLKKQKLIEVDRKAYEAWLRE